MMYSRPMPPRCEGCTCGNIEYDRLACHQWRSDTANKAAHEARVQAAWDQCAADAISEDEQSA